MYYQTLEAYTSPVLAGVFAWTMENIAVYSRQYREYSAAKMGKNKISVSEADDRAVNRAMGMQAAYNEIAEKMIAAQRKLAYEEISDGDILATLATYARMEYERSKKTLANLSHRHEGYTKQAALTAYHEGKMEANAGIGTYMESKRENISNDE